MMVTWFGRVAGCALIILCAIFLLQTGTSDATRGAGATKASSAKPKLMLEAFCAVVRVGEQDELRVEVRVANVGQEPALITSALGLEANLWLIFRDIKGKEVGSFGIDRVPARSTDPRCFLWLGADGFYGIRVRLEPARGQGGRRCYSTGLSSVSRSEFYLTAAGRYSVEAVWHAYDDGRAAGLHAWTGVVRSRKVWFELPPPRRER